MARTPEQAEANARKRAAAKRAAETEHPVMTIVRHLADRWETYIDKELDTYYPDPGKDDFTVTIVHETDLGEPLMEKLRERYTEAGWTVGFRKYGPGSFMIGLEPTMPSETACHIVHTHRP